MTVLLALLDALPFGVAAAVAGVAVASAGPLSPLLVGPVTGLAVYAGAIGLSLSVFDGDKPFPLIRGAVDILLW